ncbi:DEAD/DEAH box helicase [Alteromonas sediminis]|uniref:DEAD/DEAH box helicase n=1 Tax=Alteromonas sediminis TaxID=2259342 RepID=A0A3N5XWK6_9ALTE|nr:DEAD/DEAH box helicase [Alteromonas sediminis]RPJ65227.1 DEAD/DEAH box helicase [Alteromonas sediminis]
MNTFIEKALQRLNVTALTPIQTEVLAQWKSSGDLIGLAPTGSGKTLAFALSSIALLDTALFRPQILILCPTRELAQQVARVCQHAAQSLDNIHTVTLIGGDSVGAQIKALKGACHIVVGTPGRVLDHLEKRRLQLDKVHTRILDEADRMFEMGMREEVAAIFSHTPKVCRTGLFSATYSDAIAQSAEQWLSSPVTVDVREQGNSPDIEQFIYKTDGGQKEQAVSAILTDRQPEKCIVFCQTKKGTQALYDNLKERGFNLVTMHGDMQQNERQRALMKLSLNATNILVATDVAARGLDLPKVDLVIAYDMSESPDTHIHRIGRTGRAGQKGVAITLATDNELERAKAFCDNPESSRINGVQHLRFHANRVMTASNVAIEIRGGKKDKLRKGDIVGALIKEASVPGEDIGDIVQTSNTTFLAVAVRSAKKTLKQFREGKIKGRRYSAVKI